MTELSLCTISLFLFFFSPAVLDLERLFGRCALATSRRMNENGAWIAPLTDIFFSPSYPSVSGVFCVAWLVRVHVKLEGERTNAYLGV